jgi:hypothetical protein
MSTRDSNRWADPSKWSGAIRASSAAVNVRGAGPTTRTRGALAGATSERPASLETTRRATWQVDTFRPGSSPQC